MHIRIVRFSNENNIKWYVPISQLHFQIILKIVFNQSIIYDIEIKVQHKESSTLCKIINLLSRNY
jgi:hypothetical protein